MFSSRVSQTFAALQHPNFRLWFIGQCVSLIGTWMQSTAQGYLLYELTKSPILLGVAGFASGIPIWLFSLYSGLIADRISRHKMIIITQASMMVLAAVLAILTFTGTVQAWHIIVLAFLLGTANAFDAPARQAFVVEMVPKEDLTNAIALNSSIFNLGTVIGPSVAGLVYAWLGPGWCFTINAISFIAVLIALFLMRIPKREYVPPTQSPLRSLQEGLKYAFGDADIRTLLINLGAVSMFGFSLMTLLPAWATTVLGGDVKTNGLLLSARGVGSLAGALMIAYLGSRIVRGKIWSIGNLVMPFSLFLLGVFRVLPVSLVMLVILGWSLMSVVNISNALIQTHIPDALRGRIMSVYILVFQGSMPIGALLTGWLGSQFGLPIAIFVCAIVIFAVTSACQLFRPSMRQLN
ncbi:MAG TPA: MFS transporter [Anaerolineaceae bacterium]|nr:MFS transporter [Anaerolineaceae bacterium]